MAGGGGAPPRGGGGPPGRWAPSSGDGTADTELPGGSAGDTVPATSCQGRGTASQSDNGQPAERLGGYSRSSAYEPMAMAMSAWAQNR